MTTRVPAVFCIHFDINNTDYIHLGTSFINLMIIACGELCFCIKDDWSATNTDAFFDLTIDLNTPPEIRRLNYS